MALGVVLAPYGQNPNGTSPPYTVNYAFGPRPNQYLCPTDPQYNTRGVPGMYYDTPLGRPSLKGWWQRFKARRALRGLGDIPTDAELATVRGYTPVVSGWINTVGQGYVTGPWIPPDGQDYSGYPPPIALKGLRGLRDIVASAPVPGTVTTESLLQSMQEHNDRVFTLTLVSTTAVAVSALITIFRTLKLIAKE